MEYLWLVFVMKIHNKVNSVGNISDSPPPPPPPNSSSLSKIICVDEHVNEAYCLGASRGTNVSSQSFGGVIGGL